MKDMLSLLTTRKKQAFAALCLAKFCSVLKIIHYTISELTEHLLSILICHNLSDWEYKGTRLELTGQGDPLPESLKKIIPKDKFETFNRLLECVVEVGIIDMYGATTDEPSRFLHECVKILEDCGIVPPNVEDIFEIQQSENKQENGWGAPISAIEYENIMKIYSNIAEL